MATGEEASSVMVEDSAPHGMGKGGVSSFLWLLRDPSPELFLNSLLFSIF